MLAAISRLYRVIAGAFIGHLLTRAYGGFLGAGDIPTQAWAFVAVSLALFVFAVVPMLPNTNPKRRYN